MAVRDHTVRPFVRIISECLGIYACLDWEREVGHSNPILVKRELYMSWNRLWVHIPTSKSKSQSIWTTRRLVNRGQKTISVCTCDKTIEPALYSISSGNTLYKWMDWISLQYSSITFGGAGVYPLTSPRNNRQVNWDVLTLIGCYCNGGTDHPRSHNPRVFLVCWIDQSHKFHIAPVPYPTRHHVGTEMCTFFIRNEHIFVMYYGIGTGTLRDLWVWSLPCTCTCRCRMWSHAIL